MEFSEYIFNSIMSYNIDVQYDKNREPETVILTVEFDYVKDIDNLPAELFLNTPNFIFCFGGGTWSCGFLDQLNSI
jgi:hypothetical protein